MYEETCARMFKILRQITNNPDLKIIVATTTPTKRDEPDIPVYNEILKKVARENGGIINDLYSEINKDVENYIGADKLHLSKEGVEVAANMVVSKIEELL